MKSEDLALIDNEKVDKMYAPIVGPIQPHQRNTGGLEANFRNHITGNLERLAVPQTAFTEEYYSKKRKLHNDGLKDEGMGFTEEMRKKAAVRVKGGDPESTEYLGPWAPFVEEEARRKILMEEAEMTRKKREQEELEQQVEVPEEEEPEEEYTSSASTRTSTFHGKKDTDWAGRSWIEPRAGMKPKDSESLNYTPKRVLHSYVGHTMGINSIKFFPVYGQFILSGSLDSRIKLWETAGKRSCMRTYHAHQQAIREVTFAEGGAKFYSASLDKTVKLWDTEYGKVVCNMTNGHIAYCVTVHPSKSEQHIIITGSANKKAVQYDARTGDIVQEYSEHLQAVNTVTFCDENRKIATTADDKKMFLWEYGIPVVVKHISEPHMNSMPCVRLHPDGNFIAAQSLANEILVYEATGRFRFQGRKRFKGHSTSGYAIQFDFSPDGRFITSGDANGDVYMWDWKTVRNVRTLRGHEGVCMASAWHPAHTSRIASASWDGVIKLWE